MRNEATSHTHSPRATERTVSCFIPQLTTNQVITSNAVLYVDHNRQPSNRKQIVLQEEHADHILPKVGKMVNRPQTQLMQLLPISAKNRDVSYMNETRCVSH